MPSLSYYFRIIPAYLGAGRSQLSFWHEEPELNERAFDPAALDYYMTFRQKADYAGPFDSDGIPMLDYRGRLGRQYNPIATAQYGLANLNKHLASGDGRARDKAIACADRLVADLKPTVSGLYAWVHEFDWEYFRTLKAPWISGLAQGQGISLLVRVHKLTSDRKYLAAAERAFEVVTRPADSGGTLFTDAAGMSWIEEYITQPPTHILNGFLWALWGVRDLVLLTGSQAAGKLWEESLKTILANLERYDCGYWSLYDLAPVASRNPASVFYHKLHIVQLEVMNRISGEAAFARTAEKWRGYLEKPACCRRARLAKILFKLRYY